MTDLLAAKEKDPSCRYLSEPLLFFKGFKSLQSHRVASWLWENSRHTLAHYFQSRTSEVYGVDIHPAAKLGKGIMIDHGTGVEILGSLNYPGVATNITSGKRRLEDLYYVFNILWFKFTFKIILIEISKTSRTVFYYFYFHE